MESTLEDSKKFDCGEHSPKSQIFKPTKFETDHYGLFSPLDPSYGFDELGHIKLLACTSCTCPCSIGH